MNNQKTRNDIIKEVSTYLLKQYGPSIGTNGLPRCIDIHCRKNGKDSFFCVMAVSYNEKTNQYFDATVSSEWDFIREQREKQNEVLFVVYRKECEEIDERIVLLTPEQVLSCSLPHLTSFQIKFLISKENLSNPELLLGKQTIKETELYSAIDRFKEIKDAFR